MAKSYHTNNTALAAFLAVSNIKLVKLNVSTKPAEFIFESHNGTIDRLVFDWESGLAECNVVSFYKAYKSFVSQIVGAGNGQ